MPPISTRTSQGAASAREADPPFVYSNLGFSLLGEALRAQTGISYADLIAQRITGPLGMRDTSVLISPERRERLIQAYGDRHEPLEPWELDAFAPAGAINSTAGDMLTYLEAQLRADSPALRLSQEPRTGDGRDRRIALAWFYSAKNPEPTHTTGRSPDIPATAFFNPRGDYAGVVLVNQASSFFAALLPLHLRQRLSGEPAISLAMVTVPPSGGLSERAAKVRGLLGRSCCSPARSSTAACWVCRASPRSCFRGGCFCARRRGCKWRPSASSSASIACSR